MFPSRTNHPLLHRLSTLFVSLATLALFALVLLPGAASAAPAADPVGAALYKAFANKQITIAQLREYRTTWARSATGARRATTGQRRREIAAVRTYTTNLARRGQLTTQRLEGVLLSVHATTYYMTSKLKFPAHESEYRIPGDVAVFTYYSGRGLQFQPFETFKVGMSYVNKLDPETAEARKVADRMLELGVRRGSALVWEYYFPFGGPATPWTSAISQALGSEFFTRMAMGLPEAERAPYLAATDGMLRSFQRAPRAGGVATPEGPGRFYVMYQFSPGQRILNGHLQVLENLLRLQLLVPSDVARSVVDAGTAGVLPILSQFDTGGWSNYQPGQEAELGYHEFQTEQLVRIGRLSGNPTFTEYGQRFQTYLLTPPKVAPPTGPWLPIIPARDGYRDTITIEYFVDKRSSDAVRISDAEGKLVRTLRTSGRRGTHSVTWDGRSAGGTVLPDGEYTATIGTTDVVGNAGTTEVALKLSIQRDVTPPVIGAVTLTERGATTIVKVRAADTGSAWVTARVLIGGAAVLTRRGPRMGTITLVVPRRITAVKTGTLQLLDSSGNALDYALGA